MGNHDISDEVSSDDRAQVRDNFHTETRFGPQTSASRSSLDPGMCYRFGYGADVEFVSIDTSLARPLPTEHFFEDDRHRDFLDEALSPPGTAARGGASRSPITRPTARDPSTATPRR